MTGRAMPRLERKEQFWGKLPAFPEGIVKPWPFSVANAAILRHADIRATMMTLVTGGWF
jgi:hypothetical protein